MGMNRFGYIRQTSTNRGRGQPRFKCTNCGKKGLGAPFTCVEAGIIWPMRKCRYCASFISEPRS